MKKQFKYRALIIHISVWIVLLIINTVPLLVFNTDAANVSYVDFFVSNIPIWLMYVALFNLNYFIFVPKIFLKGRYIVYSILLLFTIAIASVGMTKYKVDRRIDIFEKAIFEESQRTDITVYRKSINIRNLEDRIKYKQDAKYYNPFYSLNLSSTYGITLVVAIGIVFALVKKWRDREKQMKEIKRQKVESELAYLKQQINPHFLFNALNSIYSLVLPHSEGASDIVLKLSSILRYMLYDIDSDRVPLSKEIEIVSDYVELQKLRSVDVSGINFFTDGICDNIYIEPLIFIPFIENAFKYGINGSDRPEISIEIKNFDNKICFSVTNRVLTKDKRDAHSGIGIKNIKRRLDIIYGAKYKMNIRDKDGLFIVEIEMPLTMNFINGEVKNF